jgi:hypothetical protein
MASPARLKVRTVRWALSAFSPAGIGIDDERQVDPVDDAGHGIGHFGGGDQTDIRTPSRA